MRTENLASKKKEVKVSTSSYSLESISGRDTIKADKHLAAARRTFQLRSSSSVYSLALSLQRCISYRSNITSQDLCLNWNAFNYPI